MSDDFSKHSMKMMTSVANCEKQCCPYQPISFNNAFFFMYRCCSARLRAKGIHVFDSYVEAATVAFEAGLLSPAGLQAVIDGTTSDLAAVTFGSSGQKRLARLQEWQSAMRRAEMVLAAAAKSAAAAVAAAHGPGAALQSGPGRPG